MEGSISKKNYWLGGIFLATLGFIFIEGSLIATTKIFGVIKATLIRVVFTIPLSWLAIYLCASTKISEKARNWFLKKQESLSRRARLAVKGGEFLAIVNTAVFLGPVLASILMIMVGVKTVRIYYYAVLCAFLSAWTWSCIYGGVFWGLEKIFRG